jgi:hypothetical protein
MPYNVVIKNEQAQPIGGIVYYYSGGVEVGQTVVPPAGIDLDAGMVESADHYRITSDGYDWYGTASIYPDGNVFSLKKKGSILLPAIAGAVLGFVIGKFVRL